jgi:type I restriction enzyme S subunit
MSDWIDTNVGSIAAKVRNALVGGPFGSNLVSSDYVDYGIPVIRGQNMGSRWVSGEFAYVSIEKANSLEANIAKPGDIIFTQRGTLGQVALVPKGSFDCYVISQSQMKLTPNRSLVEPLFLYYLFLSPQQQEYIRQNAIQVGVPHTNLGILRDTPVRLPPLVQQQSIAHILGTLDDKIELNRRMNQTLEAMAKAIFKSWFVDFDPVRAKMSGEPPKSICRRLGLTSEILDLFPDRLQDSELGELPEGWNIKTLEDIAPLKTETVQPRSFAKKLWEHYSIPAFDEGQQPVYEVGKDIKSGKYTVPVNSVLASKLNPQFPRVWLPDVQDAHSSVCSTEFMPFVPRIRGWRPFLYERLQSLPVQSEILNRTTGSTGSRQRVKPKEIAVLPCVVPTEEVVDIFCAQVGRLHDNRLSSIRQSATLASLRDALLPRLLSGELNLPVVSEV